MMQASPELNEQGDRVVLSIIKGEERYCFVFDAASKSETLKTMGRYASNPRLSFSWYDAAVLSKKVRAHFRNDK